eukprot:jgi/Mesen1/5176/ME000257S04456
MPALSLMLFNGEKIQDLPRWAPAPEMDKGDITAKDKWGTRRIRSRKSRGGTTDEAEPEVEAEASGTALEPEPEPEPEPESEPEDRRPDKTEAGPSEVTRVKSAHALVEALNTSVAGAPVCGSLSLSPPANHP